MESASARGGRDLARPESSAAAFPTTCCGGGGGGFLWDSPAKVNQKRWEQIQGDGSERGGDRVSRMSSDAGRDEGRREQIADVATVLLDRVEGSSALPSG